MNDQLDAEKVGAGGGVLLALLGAFRWMFNSRVGELQQGMTKLEHLIEGLAKDTQVMTTALEVLTKTQVTRAEFEALKFQVAKLEHTLNTLEKQAVIG